MYYSPVVVSFWCELTSYDDFLSGLQTHGHEKQFATAVLESRGITDTLLLYPGGFCILLGAQDFAYEMVV
ncbi:hypothetical protein QJS04_geneDACA007731 [Acorus gramineus]|uniref:Uncharacterized protein n=1 Tax=Acorus gramineus TaxID=55184 RepID=A0AAV9B3H1_ACOGR|nr:hypothetical protein QJS04_geneDACA007731 [Acorus gramineus]